MPTEETKRLAMKECLILWRYLAETGWDDKEMAIKKLNRNNELKWSYYFNACPFCEHFLNRCGDCLWPIYDMGGDSGRCEYVKSPYSKWRFATSTEEKKQAAAEVVKMLEGIEREMNQPMPYPPASPKTNNHCPHCNGTVDSLKIEGMPCHYCGGRGWERE